MRVLRRSRDLLISGIFFATLLRYCRNWVSVNLNLLGEEVLLVSGVQGFGDLFVAPLSDKLGYVFLVEDNLR